jgi:hypothetical protein
VSRIGDWLTDGLLAVVGYDSPTHSEPVRILTCSYLSAPSRTGRYGTQVCVCVPITYACLSLQPPPMRLTADRTAAETWVYPLNRPERDYQFNIVRKCLFDNTLVALPTGLGKTFIAGSVMLNCTSPITWISLAAGHPPSSLPLVPFWKGGICCTLKASCRSADRRLPSDLWNTWK